MTTTDNTEAAAIEWLSNAADDMRHNKALFERHIAEFHRQGLSIRKIARATRRQPRQIHRIIARQSGD